MSKLKYFAAALVLFTVSFIGGCAGMDMHTKAAEANEPERIQQISEDIGEYGYIYIIEDKETGVQYMLWDGSSYSTGVCVMVDADGKPLVSEV